jgi:uncharacterized membrane protein HdeD (DUF308 family)
MTATATTPDPQTDILSSLLARNWWAMALRGAAAIAFGLIALFLPGVTLLSLVLVFAVVMLVDGVMNIIGGVRSERRHERWVTLILQGVASLAAAAVAVLLPGLTVLAFVYVMAAWAVVSGVLGIVAAVRLRGDHGRWWMGFSGFISVIAGILLGVMPVIGAVVLTWWLGAYAVVFGVTLLVLSYRLRTKHEAATHGATPHPA